MASTLACRYCGHRAEVMLRTIPFCGLHLERLLSYVGGFRAVKDVSMMPIMLAADKLLQPTAASRLN